MASRTIQQEGVHSPSLFSSKESEYCVQFWAPKSFLSTFSKVWCSPHFHYMMDPPPHKLEFLPQHAFFCQTMGEPPLVPTASAKYSDTESMHFFFQCIPACGKRPLWKQDRWFLAWACAYPCNELLEWRHSAVKNVPTESVLAVAKVEGLFKIQLLLFACVKETACFPEAAACPQHTLAPRRRAEACNVQAGPRAPGRWGEVRRQLPCDVTAGRGAGVAAQTEGVDSGACAQLRGCAMVRFGLTVVRQWVPPLHRAPWVLPLWERPSALALPLPLRCLPSPIRRWCQRAPWR